MQPVHSNMEDLLHGFYHFRLILKNYALILCDLNTLDRICWGKNGKLDYSYWILINVRQNAKLRPSTLKNLFSNVYIGFNSPRNRVRGESFIYIFWRIKYLICPPAPTKDIFICVFLQCQVQKYQPGQGQLKWEVSWGLDICRIQ